MVNHFIGLIVVVLCVISLFRPIVLLYLIPSLIVYLLAPGVNPAISELIVLKIGTVTLFATDPIILTMGAIILVSFFTKSQRMSDVLSSPISRAILFVFLWDVTIGLISSLKGGVPFQTVLRELSWKSLMFVAVFSPWIKGFGEKKERLIQYLLFLSLLVVCFALCRFFLTGDVVLTSSGTARSIPGFPIFIFLFGLCHVLFYRGRIGKSRALAVAYLVMLCIGIHLAGHRSGYIVLIVALAASDFIIKNIGLRLSAGFLGIALIMILEFGFVFQDVQAGKGVGSDFLVRFRDIFTMENRSTQARLTMWNMTGDIVAKSPLVGLAGIAGGEEFKDPSVVYFYRVAPHNIFVDKILNEGLLGLTILMVLLVAIFLAAWRIRYDDTRYANFLLMYLLLAIIFSFFNCTFTRPESRAFLFIVVGLLNYEYIRLSNVKREKNGADNSL